MRRFATTQTPDGLSFERYRKTAHAEAVQINEEFVVETLEGEMRGQPGDYLMRGVKGELYPCAREIFEETYEAVDG